MGFLGFHGGFFHFLKAQDFALNSRGFYFEFQGLNFEFQDLFFDSPGFALKFNIFALSSKAFASEFKVCSLLPNIFSEFCGLSLLHTCEDGVWPFGGGLVYSCPCTCPHVSGWATGMGTRARASTCGLLM